MEGCLSGTGRPAAHYHDACHRPQPGQGACSALYAAISLEVEKGGWNGCYLTDPGQLGKESKRPSDPDQDAALWDLSRWVIQEMLGGQLSW